MKPTHRPHAAAVALVALASAASLASCGSLRSASGVTPDAAASALTAYCIAWTADERAAFRAAVNRDFVGSARITCPGDTEALTTNSRP